MYTYNTVSVSYVPQKKKKKKIKKLTIALANN